MTETGYFGVPGKETRSKVHIVEQDKPACGVRIGPKAEYQWCANGVNFAYLDCKRCIKKYRKEKT